MEDEEGAADTLINQTTSEVKSLGDSQKCIPTSVSTTLAEPAQPPQGAVPALEESSEQTSQEKPAVVERKVNGDCDGNCGSVEFIPSPKEIQPVDVYIEQCSAAGNSLPEESGKDPALNAVTTKSDVESTCVDVSEQREEPVGVIEDKGEDPVKINSDNSTDQCKIINDDVNSGSANDDKLLDVSESINDKSKCVSDNENGTDGHNKNIGDKSNGVLKMGTEKVISSQDTKSESLPSGTESSNLNRIIDPAESAKCSASKARVTNTAGDSHPAAKHDHPSVNTAQVRENSVIVRAPSKSEILETALAPNLKRKHAPEDHGRVGELSDPSEKFPIQYKGFKKKLIDKSEHIKIDRRIQFKGNPFNLSWKRDPKPTKVSNTAHKFNQSVEKGIEIDSSTLQPEYAQYLGLQPIVKFRCSNCGTSSFQSMSALNAHQIECKKFGKIQSPPNALPQISDSKLTNIKLTRKVFLCSACGTYYENWNLFLHMREVHRRYICLFCLGMFSVAEKLAEHLMQKHKVPTQNFSAVDDFQKICHPTYFLLCLSCDNVFSETDNFYNHVCTSQSTNDNASLNNNNNNNNNKSISENLPSNSADISSAKTLSPEMKSNNASNKSTASSKRLKVDRIQKMVSQKELSPPKRDFDDYMCSAASFCHVDIGDSFNNNHQAESLVADKSPVGENPKVLECNDNVREEKLQNDSRPPPQPEIENSSSKANNNESVQAPNKPEILVQSETPQPTKANPVEKVSTVKDKKVLKKPKIAIVKRAFKKKRISPFAKMKQLIVKAKNSEEVKSEIKVPPVEKESEPISDASEPPSQTCETEQGLSEKEDNRQTLEKGMLKMKMHSDVESDGESDDSQKLSMVVDENTSVSDYDSRKFEEEGTSHQTNSSVEDEQSKLPQDNNEENVKEAAANDDIPLAGDDVAAMALTLDDKVNNVKVQSVVKECVRTSCMSCNYCRHAVKIAVNGKQLGLHLLSEHRYTPVKNETSDDVIRKIKVCLDELNTMYFNTETYDSSDPSIHIPYDKDNNFDCFQCNYVTNSHRDLYAHKRKSHTKSLLLCIMCKSNFYSYSELLCHLCPGTYNAEIQFQNADINFRCCFCRLDTIPSAFRLMVHLRKCHHTCDICLEVCLDQQKLSTHMWKHKLNHLCYRCGIAYASKPDITKHLFWKHGTESVLCKKCLQKKWPHVYHFCIPPTSFICEECNTSFSKAVALKVHKRIHAGDFSYPCSLCEKRFISQKLLSRHEDRHKNIIENKGNNLNKTNDTVDCKEEIINVTDIPNENKDQSLDLMDTSKDSDVKDKCHKKHKKDKEKEKKSKQVVDVYDLPPLNLSSESDSSDEEEMQKKNCASNEEKSPVAEGEVPYLEDPSKVPVLDDAPNPSDGLLQSENSGEDVAPRDDINAVDSVPSTSVDPVGTNKSEDVYNESNKALGELENPQTTQDELDSNTNIIQQDETRENNASNASTNSIDAVGLEPCLNNGSTDINPNPVNENNDTVEGIWENFYKTSSQNKSLPYPLCAMKSEVAYGIIMGDHDYCQQYKSEPVINEDIPTSNIDLNLSDNKVESEEPTKPTTPVHVLDSSSNLINSASKKKQKSPKKKTSKGGNSSSSSDSSSDSDSSSCSCGTNCSCSSCSSNSSSSSSSDSDSSSTEGRLKQERRRKRKERRLKPKEETTIEAPKEPVPMETENEPPPEPEDPPIRESELETDETSTDEEFYDRHPQRIANQLLAEKRNRLMLLASVAPVNNGTSSPTQTQAEITTAQKSPPVPATPTVKQKQKVRRREGRRKLGGKTRQQPVVAESLPTALASTPQREYQESSHPATKQYKSADLKSLPHSDTPGSGSETESMRSSKRRRIPNKFYGYSSGEEEDSKPVAPPAVKWRKQDLPAQSPKRQILPPPPPTPRIQLTTPKQVINRKQINNPPKPRSDSSSNDSDSSDDEDSVPPHSGQQETQKTDVYCYCRCPYDEVSEMIACDDSHCKIEWFHFECVGILVPPRGQWFCPECRKKRGLPT